MRVAHFQWTHLLPLCQAALTQIQYLQLLHMLDFTQYLYLTIRFYMTVIVTAAVAAAAAAVLVVVGAIMISVVRGICICCFNDCQYVTQTVVCKVQLAQHWHVTHYCCYLRMHTYVRCISEHVR